MTGSEPRLRVSRVHFPVTALGPGDRLGVWLQGCPLACPGCMSLDTWDPSGGTELEVEQVVGMWRDAVAAGADGVTISGGEPLAQAPALTELLRRIDETRRASGARGRDHDLLLFTGFELDELEPAQLGATRLADVVITGRYRAAEPTDLIWRGSANQRMHLNTDLGRRRYAEFVDLAPQRPPIQVRPEHDGFWLIGVPRRGTLPQLERALRDDGLALDTVTWRRSGRPPSTDAARSSVH